MRGRLPVVTFSLVWVLACGARVEAQAALTPATSLLVLAKKDKMLSIVDPQTLRVVARVPVGPNPHEVIASDDGRTAWVSNYENGSEHTITVVDLVGRRVEQTIDLGPLWGPHGFAAAGGKIYFTAEREKLIARIDPASETVDWLLGTGQIGTHMLWVAADGTRMVSANVGSGTVSLMHQRTATPEAFAPTMLSKQGGVTTRGKDGPVTPDWEEAVVATGSKPEGFDVLTDATGHPTTIWVANAGEGTVSVVNFESHVVVNTIPAQVPTANRLRFTPDHRLALISMEKGAAVAVLDVAKHSVLQRIPVGTGAAGVLIQPDGTRAYVSCSPDNWVAVIDLKTMAVVGKIQPGTEPDGLAWAVRR